MLIVFRYFLGRLFASVMAGNTCYHRHGIGIKMRIGEIFFIDVHFHREHVACNIFFLVCIAGKVQLCCVQRTFGMAIIALNAKRHIKAVHKLMQAVARNILRQYFEIVLRLLRRERHHGKYKCTTDQGQDEDFPFMLQDHKFNLNSEKKVLPAGVLKITYLSDNFKINYSMVVALD